jgi:membrane-associated phospholipid phosphatase
MSELSRPPQEPAAGSLVARVDDRSPLAAILRDLARLDLAIYRSIAATPTPALDEPLRWLSEAATRSKLWLGMAGIMAGVGGRTGRRAALTGVAAIGVDSAIVNLVGKLSFRRVRPDPSAAGVPESRRVVMPMSSSFPSGHAASGFAFAEGVAVVSPALAGPVRALAAAVAYSRVHGGVHYPGDVVVGALIGSSVGEGVGIVARRIAPDR